MPIGLDLTLIPRIILTNAAINILVYFKLRSPLLTEQYLVINLPIAPQKTKFGCNLGSFCGQNTCAIIIYERWRNHFHRPLSHYECFS